MTEVFHCKLIKQLVLVKNGKYQLSYVCFVENNVIIEQFLSNTELLTSTGQEIYIYIIVSNLRKNLIVIAHRMAIKR